MAATLCVTKLDRAEVKNSKWVSYVHPKPKPLQSPNLTDIQREKACHRINYIEYSEQMDTFSLLRDHNRSLKISSLCQVNA